MTLGTVPEAGMGRRSETRVTPTQSRPTTDSARAQPSTRRRACPRVAALRRCHVRRPRRPCTARTGFPAASLWSARQPLADLLLMSR